MTSYEFEVAAKNACAVAITEQFGLYVPLRDIQLVWFAHELGHKKCTLYAPQFGRRYVEVTYNRDKHEMYVDVYVKFSKTVVPESDFDLEVHD